MEKTYKQLPFDVELAKKIQSGEVEGKIVTNEGNEVEIIRFDLIQNSFPILAIIHIPNVVSDYWEDAKLFQLNGKHGNEKLWLEIELPEEQPKAKLTKQKVKDARWERACKGTSFQKLADKYGVCKQTLMNAIKGKTWKCATYFPELLKGGEV